MPRLSILAGGSAAAALAVKYISPEYLLGSTVWTAAVLFLPQLLCLVLWRWIILPRYFSVLRDLPTAPVRGTATRLGQGGIQLALVGKADV